MPDLADLGPKTDRELLLVAIAEIRDHRAEHRTDAEQCHELRDEFYKEDGILARLTMVESRSQSNTNMMKWMFAAVGTIFLSIVGLIVSHVLAPGVDILKTIGRFAFTALSGMLR